MIKPACGLKPSLPLPKLQMVDSVQYPPVLDGGVISNAVPGNTTGCALPRLAPPLVVVPKRSPRLSMITPAAGARPSLATLPKLQRIDSVQLPPLVVRRGQLEYGPCFGRTTVSG